MTATPQHQGEDQRRNPGGRVHDDAAGEVDHALVGQPAAAPDPMGHGRITEEQPESGKDQHGGKVHTLDERAHDQRRSDDRESHLEHEEQGFRNGLTVQRRACDACHHAFCKAAQIAAFARPERDGIAAHEPDQADQAGNGKAVHEHRQQILCLHETAIEEGQPRKGHEQDQRRRGEDPGRVPCVGMGGQGNGPDCGHKQACACSALY